MPCYLIVNYNVENPEMYGEYAAAAGPAMKMGGVTKLLAFDTKTEQLEGEGAGHQTVVVKFDSKEQAKEIIGGDAYQAIVGKRLDATSKHFAILINTLE